MPLSPYTFRRFLTAAIVLFCASFFTTVWFIRAANADGYGPPPGPGDATCDGYYIDPPTDAHVTAVVTLDEQTFPSVTVTYDQEETHRANFAWTADELAVLNVPGPHAWSIDFTWDIGTGTTTLSGTFTCVEPPPVVTPPADTPPPVVVPPASVTPPATPPHPAAPQSPPGGMLPHTGSNSLGLVLAAVALIASGVGVARKFRTVGR